MAAEEINTEVNQQKNKPLTKDYHEQFFNDLEECDLDTSFFCSPALSEALSAPHKAPLWVEQWYQTAYHSFTVHSYRGAVRKSN